MTARGRGEVTTTTWACSPRGGSALDPLVEQVTWIAREMTAADPSGVDRETLQSITGGFDHLVEVAWQPGRSVLVSEVSTVPGEAEPLRLQCRLAVGMLGPVDATALEIEGLRPVIDDIVHSPLRSPFRSQPIDPAMMFGGLGGLDDSYRAAHTALIRQRSIDVGVGSDTVEVVSRYHPTIEPWILVARRLVDFSWPVTVRATLLATQLSPLDRLQLEHAASRLQAIGEQTPVGTRVYWPSQIDRALATLVDLKASFTSPVFVCELAVVSTHPLPESLLRSIGSAFTSETEVHRHAGSIVVAAQRLLLGGFEIEHDPTGLAEALRAGLPLHGGLGPRELRDLVTLTESPIGWPVPFGGPVPTIEATPHRTGPVPAGLRGDSEVSGVVSVLGTAGDGSTVGLPVGLRPLHTLVTGTWGSGKSTVLTRMALGDLRAGRPFLFIDPHGTAADWLAAFAEHLDVPVVIFDAEDGDTSRMAPFPELRSDGANRAEVESAIAHLADAIASSLPNAEWAGPRWHATVRSMFEVAAAHRADLSDTVTWLNDPQELQRRLEDPAVSALSRSTLANLIRTSSEADSVRGWASSKLHAIVSGPARQLFARPGSGIELCDVVRSETPVIVNLGSLSTAEAELVGHIALARVLDAAVRRPPTERALYTCYVDEAHRFPVRGLSRVLAEGRKFGIGLVLATQALSQLPGELADLTMGVSTSIAFRATPDTAVRLAPVLDTTPSVLMKLPDLRCIIAVSGIGTTEITVPPYELCPKDRVKRPPGVEQRDPEPPRATASSPAGDAGFASTGSVFLDVWLSEHP